MLYRFDAFICHSSVDANLTDPVHSGLVRSGYTAWYDKQAIHAGQGILTEIRKGLQESRFLLFCHTARAHESRWVLQEFEAMRFEEINTGIVKTIFLVFDDTPLPFDVRHKKYVDFRLAESAAWSELFAALDEGSARVIAYCKANLLVSKEIGESARKLGEIAFRRRDIEAVAALFEAMKVKSNHHDVVDAVAHVVGQLACTMQDDTVLEDIKRAIEGALTSATDLIVDKLAYTIGQIAMSAEANEMGDWARIYIGQSAASRDPQISQRFTYTMRRIEGN